MHRNSFFHYIFICIFFTISSTANIASAESEYRLSGPFTHDNLTIYLVHGKSISKTVPLTLQEALKKGVVKVHETSNVNELSVENTGKEQIFIQSGELVKGGKQDRVLTTSLLLSPNSGRVPIDAFCVEQNRWAPRGKETVAAFHASSYAAPSRKMKMAMKAPTSQSQTQFSGEIGGSIPYNRQGRPVASNDRQSKVWKNVSEIQEKLSKKLDKDVKSRQSPSSLQLALEDKKLKANKKAYTEALKTSAEKESDVIGYVFAINNELNSADIYPSNGLFKKLWPKLLDASAIEAIAEKGEKTTGKKIPPSKETVLAFLTNAHNNKGKSRKLNKDIKLETKDGKEAVFFETQYKKNKWIHRNYIAKDKPVKK